MTDIARIKLLGLLDEADALTRMLTVKSAQRDDREPGVDLKMAVQGKLFRAIRAYFRAQAGEIKNGLAQIYPDRKNFAGDLPLSLLSGNWGDLSAEIVRVLIEATRGGVGLLAGKATIGVDWSGANVLAATWARKHAGELIKEIDSVTLDALREAIRTFIETPGFAIGDIMAVLPFDESRALTIAVTETTNAFAQGQKIAAEEARRSFPQVKIIHTWFTNEDDRVCEICGDLDGQEVDIDEKFRDSSGAEYDRPAAHPNCRCWDDYRTTRGRA